MTHRPGTAVATPFTQALATALAFAAILSPAPGLRAQAPASRPEQYTARLEWVPIAGSNRVTGKGTATGTLSGSALAIAGRFEALGGPATIMRLHQGIAKGARGKALADIAVPAATSGAFTASVTLNDEQIAALRQGKLYLQLHGDKGLAPDGANLWGWFLR